MTSDDAERALLAERILTEQEERRRLAELLHDGPVQHLSAIAQMLDAGLASLRDGETQRADEVFTRGLALARDSARDLRALCEDLEPRVLSELGFSAAVGALARRLSSRHDVEIDLDVDHADELGENAQTALYQILREATDQALRRGAPTRIEISVRATAAGGAELVVTDDGPPERRSAVLEALADRAATLNARFSSEVRYPRGSTVRIEVPPSAARR
ncbi:MAG: histidine kinase [Thermoleophilia bacterium]|nr:histidine kinase [Thermoleophilia bacterium]